MSRTLTADDARQALTGHLTGKGDAIFAKYGPTIGWSELGRILADRSVVRYPCEVVFAAEPLQPGEFAHPVPRGEQAQDGFDLYVHPAFESQRDRVPYLVLYQLVVVNYGDLASPDDAETFGAAALGLTKQAYYEAVCCLADEVTACDSEAPSPGLRPS